ncbi:winged helix-turn-helix transcriptional regulator [Actinoallomurus sp. NPDC052274]|uniref:winged helix-turn-helix transcriptional regulator n=1 Tax=Actinoallomurus sp. NPDC052274 TaxID=3155420 RepID=UPI00343DDAF2
MTGCTTRPKGTGARNHAASVNDAVPDISATSLNDRLRDLIDAGLVTRHAFPGPPLSSSYEVTAAGALVGAHLNRMLDAILADLHG